MRLFILNLSQVITDLAFVFQRSYKIYHFNRQNCLPFYQQKWQTSHIDLHILKKFFA